MYPRSGPRGTKSHHAGHPPRTLPDVSKSALPLSPPLDPDSADPPPRVSANAAYVKVMRLR
jgi:hypothetical protein